ncbi:MAG: hypothetical protein KDD89_11915 [Anaerolineales bacterium]|nr:hypothetical protein [Anaerolineales bacterium]
MSKNRVRVEVFYTNMGQGYRAVEEVPLQKSLEETFLAAWREVFRKEGKKSDMLYLYANALFDSREAFGE